MSLATQTRDAVVSAINGAPLTPRINAVGIYEISFGLSDLTGGRISVMPANDKPELLTRGGVARREIPIDVGVQYKVTKTTPADQLAELDPYLTLAESILTLFFGKALPSKQLCTEAGWPNGLWLPDHMQKFNVLTSVVRLTFVSNQ